MAKSRNIVKRAKTNISVLLILIVAISWLCVITTFKGNHAEAAQESLILKAQEYLNDKLYIRAIENYETAIKEYKTDKNITLQAELLPIYLEAGMLAEYYGLMETRIEERNAQEEEYLKLAEYYLEQEAVSRAIAVLQKGIAEYESEEMIQRKEACIYGNRVEELGIQQALQPAENWLIPSFDGNKWGYVSDKGKVKLDFIYEEATAFCNGYAVVKLNGIYTVINEEGQWYGIDKIGLDAVAGISENSIVGIKDGKYGIYSKSFELRTEETFDNLYIHEDGLYVAQKGDKWGVLDKNLKTIVDYELTDVVENSRGTVFYNGCAIVNDGTGYYHMDAKGKALYDTRFADAKGYEGGLVAVANESGKWGIANSKGELVVDYQYEDAFSFSSKLAAVKVDGKWGYINQYNQMVIEAEYEMASPFIGKKALVHTFMDTYKVITLMYYDLF